MDTATNGLSSRLTAGDPALAATLREVKDRLSAVCGTTAGDQLAKDAYPAMHSLAAHPDAMGGPDLVDSLLSVATHYYAAGRADLALDPAEDASAVALRLSDVRRSTRAHNLSGVMSVMTLDYPGALTKLKTAWQQATNLREPEWEALTVAHIGVAHMTAAQYADAMEAFDHVLRSTAGRDDLARPRQIALSNMAFVALQTRDVAKGISAIEDSLRGTPEPTSPVEFIARVALEQIFVRLLVEVRQPERARERAVIAKDMAARSGSLLAQTNALCAEGIAEIAAGARDIGLTRLKRALEQARTGAEGSLRDILVASARGYQLAGQPDVASLHLHELALINRRSRTSQVRLHHARHIRNVEREWADRLAAAEDAQQRELRAQMDSGMLAKSAAEYLEKASIAAELFDDVTGYHVFRVGAMAREIAKRRGIDEHTCMLLELGARQHDIGKVMIPESILNKPGKFTPTERQIMETHAAEGARLIREAAKGLPQMHIAEEIAHHHHERWDGTGYPVRLKGSQIPLSARITAIADVFDALSHRRPYKEAWTITESLAEISRGRGTHFDPELTDIFLDLVPGLMQQHADIEAFLCEPAANCTFIHDREAINRELREVNAFDRR